MLLILSVILQIATPWILTMVFEKNTRLTLGYYDFNGDYWLPQSYILNIVTTVLASIFLAIYYSYGLFELIMYYVDGLYEFLMYGTLTYFNDRCRPVKIFGNLSEYTSCIVANRYYNQ